MAGITVVAIERNIAASHCTQRLVNAGARVIKIDRAHDEAVRHDDRTVHGFSACTAWLDRGKESICLDLKAEADLALIKAMLAKADVLVHDLALGETGVDLNEVHLDNPHLVCVGVVGYGRDTPYRSRLADEVLIEAESGLSLAAGTAPVPSIAALVTSMNVHAAVLEALIQRARIGIGRRVEVAMFDSVMDWMNLPILHHLHGSQSVADFSAATGSIGPYGRYACSDGEVVISVRTPGEWTRFCKKVLRQPHLEADQPFGGDRSRIANCKALDREIAQIMAGLTVKRAAVRLNSARLNWSRVSTVEELARHPACHHARASAGGRIFPLAAPPLHPDVPIQFVPRCGEHGAALRREFSASGR